MAASDLAAAFTAVVISYWTNWSFRQPLIFCAAVCVVGNVVYCMRCVLHEVRVVHVLREVRVLHEVHAARA